MAVSHGEVLAEDFNVLDGFIEIVMNVLLDYQDGLVTVRVLELLGQFVHSQVVVFIGEGHKFELEIDFCSAGRLLRRLLLMLLV